VGSSVYGMLGYGLAGCCYATAAASFTGGNMWVFAGCLIMVGFTNDSLMGPSWATRRTSADVIQQSYPGDEQIGNLGAHWEPNHRADSGGILRCRHWLMEKSRCGHGHRIRHLLHDVRNRLRLRSADVVDDRPQRSPSSMRSALRRVPETAERLITRPTGAEPARESLVPVRPRSEPRRRLLRCTNTPIRHRSEP